MNNLVVNPDQRQEVTAQQSQQLYITPLVSGCPIHVGECGLARGDGGSKQGWSRNQRRGR
jgi:hypothetical protein